MSSREGEASAQAGFMLVEVLVAVVIAGLFLSALGQALAGAWRAARIPADVVSAATLARTALELPDGTRETLPGYAVRRSVRLADLVDRPSELARAPLASVRHMAAGVGLPPPNDIMPGVTRHGPSSGDPSGRLEWVSVLVQTPRGRMLRFETVRLDAAQN